MMSAREGNPKNQRQNIEQPERACDVTFCLRLICASVGIGESVLQTSAQAKVRETEKHQQRTDRNPNAVAIASEVSDSKRNGNEADDQIDAARDCGSSGCVNDALIPTLSFV